MEQRRNQERRLRQLHDVSGQRPEDGQVLLWDAGVGKWVPGDVSSDIDPDDFAPALHASQHFTGGDDEITPADIGASPDTHDHDGVYSPINHNHDDTYRQLSVPIDTVDVEDEAITEDKLSQDVQDKLNAGGGVEGSTQAYVSGSFTALPQSVSTLYSSSSLDPGTYQVFWGMTIRRSSLSGGQAATVWLANDTTQVGPTITEFNVGDEQEPRSITGTWRVTSASSWTPRLRGRAFAGGLQYGDVWISILKIG